ncbi:MAG: alpha-glucosidase [Bacteroidetes bacterium]|nr:alpha-glucosidase [Bacteroidota bacterium]
MATVYGDASTAHWKDNPMAYEIRKVLVQSASVLKQQLAAGGGVAISVKKAAKTDMKGLKKLK